MDVLLKNVVENFRGRKFHDHCDIIRDGDLHASIQRNQKKLRLFIRPDGSAKSIKKEEYLKNYGNKLWSIDHRRTTIILENNDDKVSLKFYLYHRHRNEGQSYFTITNSVEFLTYNKKTKITYVGVKQNKKNLKSYVRSNAWNDFTLGFFGRLQSILKFKYDNGEELFFKYVSVFFHHLYGKEVYVIDNGKFNPLELLLKNYLIVHNVVIPNNFLAFYNGISSVKLKELKNSNYNLIDAVEKKYELSGKKFHRVLHMIKNINPPIIQFVKHLIPIKFLKSRPDQELVELFQSKEHFELTLIHKLLNKHISDKERINMYTCLIDCIMNSGSIYTFSDHIKFYLTLKIRYNEDVKWLSKTRNDFSKEHVEFSNKIARHKNGVWNRIYSQRFYDGIGKEIITPQGGVYYPVLFTKQKEYYDESETQSNCVKTYVKDTDCFIISLREGSVESKERSTIEYKFNHKEQKFERRQSLGKFNRVLDVKWNFALEQLDNQVLSALKYFKYDEFKMFKITQTEKHKFHVVKSNHIGYKLVEDGLADQCSNSEISNEEYLKHIFLSDLES